MTTIFILAYSECQTLNTHYHYHQDLTSYILIRPIESKNNKLGIIEWRLAHYSEAVGSTDLIFGVQGALMCLVETLEFQNTQRS